MKKNVTIKDIARMAGTSHAVVSVVLSSKASTIRVSEKLREKIQALASEYHYRPNLAARGFKFKKSYLIGIFFNGSCDFILMRLLEEARAICYEHSYDLILYPSTSLEMERRSIESARSRNLDGVITVPFVSEEGNNIQGYRQFLHDGIPVVQLLYRLSDEFSFVGRDYHATGFDSMRAIFEHGHQRAGLILYDIYQNVTFGRSSHDFFIGAEAAAKEFGIELQLYPVELSKEFSEEPCADVVRSIMSRPVQKRPTVLISASNTLLHKVYGHLLDAGVQVPQKISLLGCGEDLDRERSLLPELSTLKTPFHDMVEAAISKIVMPDAPQSQGTPEFKSTFYEGATLHKLCSS